MEYAERRNYQGIGDYALFGGLKNLFKRPLAN